MYRYNYIQRTLSEILCFVSDATNITYEQTTTYTEPISTTDQITTTTSQMNPTTTPIATTNNEVVTTSSNIPITTVTNSLASTATEQTSATTSVEPKMSTLLPVVPTSWLLPKRGCCTNCFSISEQYNVSDWCTTCPSGSSHCTAIEDKNTASTMTTEAATTVSVVPKPNFKDTDHLQELMAALPENVRSRLGYDVSHIVLSSHYSGYTVPLR